MREEGKGREEWGEGGWGDGGGGEEGVGMRVGVAVG